MYEEKSFDCLSCHSHFNGIYNPNGRYMINKKVFESISLKSRANDDIIWGFFISKIIIRQIPIVYYQPAGRNSFE